MSPPLHIPTPFARRGLAVFVALAACVAGLAGPRLYADSPWQSASVYWEDYTPDHVTEALYHLDDAAIPETVEGFPLPAAIEAQNMWRLRMLQNDPAWRPLGLNIPDLLDELKGMKRDVAAEMREGLSAQRTVKDGLVQNAVAGGAPGVLLGEAACATDARLRGYLALAASGAQLRMPIARGPQVRTLEWRVRLEALPTAPSSLAQIRVIRAAAVAGAATAALPEAADEAALLHWAVLPDGGLRVHALGLPIAVAEGVRLEPGTWAHLAVIWGRGSAAADLLRLYVNGVEIGRASLAAGTFPMDIAAQATFGGDGGKGDAGGDEGESGWRGQLDEIRLSAAARTWYSVAFGPIDRTFPQPGVVPTAADENATNAADVTPDRLHLAGHNRTFLLSFDGANLTPRIFKGATTKLPKQVRDLRLIDDQPRLFDAEFPFAVRERGMRLGADFERPAYPAWEHLDLIRGSLALWVKPDNWDTLTRRLAGDAAPPVSATLFRLVRVDRQLYYDFQERRPQAPQDMMVLSASLTPAATATDGDEGPTVPLHPGAWTHVIVTWDGPKVGWFINGKPHPTGGPFSLRLPHLDADDSVRWLFPTNWADMAQAHFQLGPGPETPVGEPSPTTVIDDFLLYSEPVTATQAAAIYELAGALSAEEAAQTQAIPPGANLDWRPESRPKTPSQQAAEFLQRLYQQPRSPGEWCGTTSVPPPRRLTPSERWPRTWH